jgi:hypothetical protein
MANYTTTFSFTAAQEAGFDMRLKRFNDRRAQAEPPLPALTKQQYIDRLASDLPAEMARDFRDDFRDRCSDAMRAATVATLQSVATTLGVDINPYD